MLEVTQGKKPNCCKQAKTLMVISIKSSKNTAIISRLNTLDKASIFNVGYLSIRLNICDNYNYNWYKMLIKPLLFDYLIITINLTQKNQ